MRPALIALALLLAASSAKAAAQQARYLDDRSTAERLVQSLYSAINRGEYARAWSYFGNAKPTGSLAAFRQGYATTRRVRVAIGKVASEGAAGSTYFSVPVAISATMTDGGEKVFAGCYTARLVNPALQEESFAPMSLESGRLAPSDKPFRRAVPASCPGAP